jgi:3-hydroxymyristoyl/3-hydroxydecanoyl-(acyl carrier protein) dehydratase
MTLLPEVTAIERSDLDPDRVVVRLRVPPELGYFDGHFPGLPVLPGVVQVHWAARLAAAHLGQSCLGSRIEQLKFLAIVRPGDELGLTLRLDRTAGMLSFSYASPTRAYSSGRISFE